MHEVHDIHAMPEHVERTGFRIEERPYASLHGLEGLAAHERRGLGPEREQQAPSGPVSSVAIFWVVLVGAVIVLFTLIVRLLGKNPPAP